MEYQSSGKEGRGKHTPVRISERKGRVVMGKKGCLLCDNIISFCPKHGVQGVEGGGGYLRRD